MAAPGGKYFVHDKLKIHAPHHEDFKALWDTKWRAPCEAGIYPFMFGCAKDFEPVVEELVKKNAKAPYDWDAYAKTFFPQAKTLVDQAVAAKEAGEDEKASELFLRGSALYRISRFPAPRSELQYWAWAKGKDACLRGLSLRPTPTREVNIPHSHGLSDEGTVIPVYYTVPKNATASAPVPLIMIFTGLDGYRTELAVWINGWLQVGCATLIVEIPGTGDSPADPSDPTSPDRQWSSVLDWLSLQSEIDKSKLVCWGFSTGGYYSIRIAHTHPTHFAGVVALGGGCHYMFDPEWLDATQHLEYPFDLATTLCHKFGYGDDYKKFKREASNKFSLLKDGTLDTPGCARLLLVNGTDDEIFPIDDYYLCLQHGDPKEARFVPHTKHMGEPMSFSVILKWIYKLLDIRADPVEQLRTLPFKPKY